MQEVLLADGLGRRVSLASVVLGMHGHLVPRLPLQELVWLQTLHEAVHVDAHHVAATVALSHTGCNMSWL